MVDKFVWSAAGGVTYNKSYKVTAPNNVNYIVIMVCSYLDKYITNQTNVVKVMKGCNSMLFNKNSSWSTMTTVKFNTDNTITIGTTSSHDIGIDFVIEGYQYI